MFKINNSPGKRNWDTDAELFLRNAPENPDPSTKDICGCFR